MYLRDNRVIDIKVKAGHDDGPQRKKAHVTKQRGSK